MLHLNTSCLYLLTESFYYADLVHITMKACATWLTSSYPGDFNMDFNTGGTFDTSWCATALTAAAAAAAAEGIFSTRHSQSCTMLMCFATEVVSPHLEEMITFYYGKSKMAAQYLRQSYPVNTSAPRNKFTALKCTVLKCTGGTMQFGTHAVTELIKGSYRHTWGWDTCWPGRGSAAGLQAARAGGREYFGF